MRRITAGMMIDPDDCPEWAADDVYDWGSGLWGDYWSSLESRVEGEVGNWLYERSLEDPYIYESLHLKLSAMSEVVDAAERLDWETLHNLGAISEESFEALSDKDASMAMSPSDWDIYAEIDQVEQAMAKEGDQ